MVYMAWDVPCRVLVSVYLQTPCVIVLMVPVLVNLRTPGQYVIKVSYHVSIMEPFKRYNVYLKVLNAVS